MSLVALGHMFPDYRVLVGRRTSHVGGNTLTEMKDFNRGGREARFQLLAGELVGDAVIMSIHFDVVIDISADRFQLAIT